jgi:hypothetical protein
MRKSFGAFRNPTPVVARLDREEIEKRASDFSVIAFAIFAAGYGPEQLQAVQRRVRRE